MAGEPRRQRRFIFDDYSIEEVPIVERYGLYNVFLTLSASFGAIAVLFAGGVLGGGLNFTNAIIAVMVGNIILSIIGALSGVIGAYSGLSTYVGWRLPFGRVGGKLLGFALITITTGIGWFAVESWFFGVVMNEIYPNNPFFSVWAAALWGGALMILSTYIGYRALSFLSYFILPQHVWLIAVGLFLAISLHGGWGAVWTAVPKSHMSLADAITATVGLYIAGSLIAPDITRFAKRPRDSVVAWVLHMFVFYPFLILGAVAIVLLTGSVIITEDMLKLGMGLGILLIIVLGQWIINTVNLYSGSLSFTNAIPIRRDYSSIIVGIIGTLLAAYWGYTAGASLAPFESFITVLGSLLPAAGGSVFAEFFIVKPYLEGVKNPFERFKLIPGKEYPELNLTGILSFAAGALAGFFLTVGIAAINAILVAFIVHVILAYAFKRTEIKYELGKYVYMGGVVK
ncbi:purine-cytosine permease family protein [Caldivirga maquilingensis]|uniref:Permease for cytosine/purines uracil thiamine allantoin n=1 Tax=Caldivirga maquilingensis (strain ATCC 700844 / DSM 13496 / JCM 10307 / IC-167) TaxID=397948 RepID=A8MB16_CALMQ|nr:cytosine permease [Caldivirga maquilingensis]ABW02645.1 permease for cytosine/purines uracil thiamine allantoin [Caldivirga maquilingensis IC-167]